MWHLCKDKKALIERVVDDMRLLWQQHSQEEDRGVLLVDSLNLFNVENHMVMLWAVWFECPSGVVPAPDGTIYIVYINGTR